MLYFEFLLSLMSGRFFLLLLSLPFSFLVTFLLALLLAFPSSVLSLPCPGFGCIVCNLILILTPTALSSTPPIMSPTRGLRQHSFIEKGTVASNTPLCCLKKRHGCPPLRVSFLTCSSSLLVSCRFRVTAGTCADVVRRKCTKFASSRQ